MAQIKRTQDFVAVKEIRDGVIIREDNVYSGVLIVSPTNFELKSADERVSIIGRFQALLNSLDDSVQILTQSRKLDIKPYILKTEELLKKQENELLKTQTREYINFIKTLTDSTNIVSKNFFIIVSHYPNKITGGGSKGIFKFFKKQKASADDAQEQTNFEQNRQQLNQKLSYVVGGLNSMGLKSEVLKTDGVIELLYLTFNPGDSTIPKI